MNRNTIIAKVKHAELLTDWEQIIRELWDRPLRPLDAGYMWCYEGHETPSMLSLIFCAPNNNTHRDTDWFLVNHLDNEVARYTEQAKMFADVLPVSGICYTLWFRGFWQEIARSPYAFNMQRKNGELLNLAENK